MRILATRLHNTKLSVGSQGFFCKKTGKRNPHRTPLLIHGKTGGDAVLTWWQQHMT